VIEQDGDALEGAPGLLCDGVETTQ
jgi:hypothetical protein